MKEGCPTVWLWCARPSTNCTNEAKEEKEGRKGGTNRREGRRAARKEGSTVIFGCIPFPLYFFLPSSFPPSLSLSPVLLPHSSLLCPPFLPPFSHLPSFLPSPYPSLIRRRRVEGNARTNLQFGGKKEEGRTEKKEKRERKGRTEGRKGEEEC